VQHVQNRELRDQTSDLIATHVEQVQKQKVANRGWQSACQKIVLHAATHVRTKRWLRQALITKHHNGNCTCSTSYVQSIEVIKEADIRRDESSKTVVTAVQELKLGQMRQEGQSSCELIVVEVHSGKRCHVSQLVQAIGKLVERHVPKCT